MDFAYLNKPVLYCQFDKETFFAGNHMYEPGYFEYEKDGFGKVIYDIDSCVDELVKLISSECKLEDEYAQRIKGFFQYQDQSNCERVYQKIMNLLDDKGGV